MQDQWLEPAKPGCKVKVKIKDELTDARSLINFILKLSFDSYFYATVKAEVKLADTSSTREFQFREFKFCHTRT